MKSLKQLRKPKEIVVIESKSPADLENTLCKAIDDQLSKKNETTFKKVGGFHPSYTNQCSRYWYYLFEGVNVTPDFSPQTHRIFDNGHAVHERLYSYFRDMGILVDEEIKVTYSDPPIEGTADGIINWYGDKLIELKTICHCGRKANFVVRLDEQGLPATAGSQVQIGGNESYVSMCRQHFKDLVWQDPD